MQVLDEALSMHCAAHVASPWPIAGRCALWGSKGNSGDVPGICNTSFFITVDIHCHLELTSDSDATARLLACGLTSASTDDHQPRAALARPSAVGFQRSAYLRYNVLLRLTLDRGIVRVARC